MNKYIGFLFLIVPIGLLLVGEENLRLSWAVDIPFGDRYVVIDYSVLYRFILFYSSSMFILYFLLQFVGKRRMTSVKTLAHFILTVGPLIALWLLHRKGGGEQPRRYYTYEQVEFEPPDTTMLTIVLVCFALLFVAGQVVLILNIRRSRRG